MLRRDGRVIRRRRAPAALDDLIGGENHTVGFQRVHAQRNGAAIDQRTVIVFALKDGKVSEVYEFPEDTAKAAEFWS